MLKKLKWFYSCKLKPFAIKKIVNLKYGRGIAEYKNKYEGQRCFVIGNGPSLTLEDLEKLSDEITFASHLIFQSFDKTKWRPTFYCVEDTELLENNIQNIINISSEYEQGFFTGNTFYNLPKAFLNNKKNSFWFVDNFRWDKEPDFSLNANSYIAEGFTVTYAIIQLAVYMGFKEIYLLGVDHHYTADNSYSSMISDGKIYNTPKLDKSTLSYKKAEEVCDSVGVKIKNATRGGHLEVYERVDLDEVLK